MTTEKRESSRQRILLLLIFAGCLLVGHENGVVSTTNKEEITAKEPTIRGGEVKVAGFPPETVVTAPTAPRTRIDWDEIECPGNTEPWHNCDLTEKYWGVPTILISMGRSGSTVTWDTMTALASPRRGQKASESTGGSLIASVGALESIGDDEHGKCWMHRILCDHQQENRVLTKQGVGKSKLYGTKWKPFIQAFNHTKSREALQWIAQTPIIKVIYNERDPLDITISRWKHIVYENVDAPSHCFREKCAESVIEMGKELRLDLDFMMQSMSNLTKELDDVRSILDALHVDRVTVSYERLFYANHAEEWNRLLAHLGAGGVRSNFTKAEVAAEITHFETHARTREDAIANYDEVAEALRGTPYEGYLTPVDLIAAGEENDANRRWMQSTTDARRIRRLLSL
jgi:hypothetical protein